MLSLAHLDKVYPNGAHALDDVSLDVEAGEIVALVGGSGCGKTTLLRLIMGREAPSHGTVNVDGQGNAAPPPGICIEFYVPGLRPWLTVALDFGFGR